MIHGIACSSGLAVSQMRALIGLGSNLGNSAQILQQAAQQLHGSAARLLRLSSFVASPAVGGPPGQREFVNAAATLETDWTPHQLATRLHELEDQLGRTRVAHWGPRLIDLDLLLCQIGPCESEPCKSIHIESPKLSIPHPRMALRPFVLAPACQIAAEFQHPLLRQSIEQLWRNLTDSSRWIWCESNPQDAWGEKLAAALATGKGESWHIGTRPPEPTCRPPRLALRFVDQPSANTCRPVTLESGRAIPTLELPRSGWDGSALSDIVALIQGTETPLRWL